jgi:transposase-like protein
LRRYSNELKREVVAYALAETQFAAAEFHQVPLGTISSWVRQHHRDFVVEVQGNDAQPNEALDEPTEPMEEALPIENVLPCDDLANVVEPVDEVQTIAVLENSVEVQPIGTVKMFDEINIALVDSAPMLKSFDIVTKRLQLPPKQKSFAKRRLRTFTSGMYKVIHIEFLIKINVV